MISKRRTERAEHLFGYIEQISSLTNTFLLAELNKDVNRQLFFIIEDYFDKNLRRGENTEYYKEIEVLFYPLTEISFRLRDMRDLMKQHRRMICCGRKGVVKSQI